MSLSFLLSATEAQIEMISVLGLDQFFKGDCFLLNGESFLIHKNYRIVGNFPQGGFCPVFKLYIDFKGEFQPLAVCSNYNQLQDLTGMNLNSRLAPVDIHGSLTVTSSASGIQYKVQPIPCEGELTQYHLGRFNRNRNLPLI